MAAMLDHHDVYLTSAAEYDELVSAADYGQHILPAPNSTTLSPARVRIAVSGRGSGCS